MLYYIPVEQLSGDIFHKRRQTRNSAGYSSARLIGIVTFKWRLAWQDCASISSTPGFRSQNDPCKHLPQLFHSQDRIKNFPHCLSYQFLESQFGEYGIGSTNISLINICLSSHSLSASCCVNIVTGNSILVTHGSWQVSISNYSSFLRWTSFPASSVFWITSFTSALM